jgi:GTP-binding protein
MVAERGRALIIAVNKWDGIPTDKRDEIRTGLDLRLPFLDFAPIHFISALHGSGVGDLVHAVDSAYVACMREMPTPELTRVLEKAMEQHQPPLIRGRRIKLRYAHQGGKNPPIIVIHGNQINQVPDAYRRYLANVFRKTFKLDGTPVRVEFRSDENPFKDKRSPMTPRQRRTAHRDEHRAKHRKS